MQENAAQSSTASILSAEFAPELPLAIAFSGGADSTALLLACWQRWPDQVLAIHVNHGLQKAAGEFEAFCREFCTQRNIPLSVVHTDASHQAGQSPEEAARHARYLALELGATQLEKQFGLRVASIALAQHADDQVETLLLALSRGAGLPGMAAMPAQWLRGVWQWYRPLLHVPGPELRSWLQAQQQLWIEDPTNTELHFTRNRIRHLVLPAVEAVFPSFRRTFTRSSEHAAQAQSLLVEVAKEDLLGIGLPPVLRRLQNLSPARQANVLRHWLVQHHHTSASAAQLQELLRQVAVCTTRGHAIRLKVGAGYIIRENECLNWVK